MENLDDDAGTGRMTPRLEDIENQLLNDKLHKAVHEAARYSNLNLNNEIRNELWNIQSSLKSGADPNSKDLNEKTCLHHIVRMYREAALNEIVYDLIIEKLLLAGASPYIMDDEKSSPLICAIISNNSISRTENLAIVNRLIVERANVDEPDWRGCTSLHHAAHLGRDDLVKILLTAGASPHSFDSLIGNTPLLEVISAEDVTQSQRLDIMEQLIAAGADINAANRLKDRGVHLACQREDKEVLEWLLAHGAGLHDANENGYTAMLIAAKIQNMELLRWLVDKGSDINHVNGYGVNDDDTKPMTALHIAVMNDNMEMLRYLLEHGANTNQTIELGESLLYFTLTTKPRNLFTILELLLSHGADMYMSGAEIYETPFELLMYANRLDEMQLFLEHGLDLARCVPRDMYDFSPLHVAIECSRGDEMLSLLFEYNAENLLNLEHMDQHGYTPLHTAVLTKSPDCVKFLLDSGSDVNHVARNGYNVLKLATLGFDTSDLREDATDKNIQLLVEAGAKLGNILEELMPDNSMDQILDGIDEELMDFEIDTLSQYARYHYKRAKSIIKYRVLYESRFSTVAEPIEQKIVNGSLKLQRFWKLCTTEIISLKESLYHNLISFHSVIIADDDFIKRVRDNVAYVKFEEQDLEAHFPIYADVFRCRIEDLKYWHEIWEKAVEKLNRCLSSLISAPDNFYPNVYYFIVVNILNHLYDDDLHSLAEV
ncbi:hypothetical protein QAD02_023984 [Eretmocerus hayati]|uniref:Uncharacterized protein n=1 Tax=Eretmocerus hayati TaxID=131215 RepID=A0ACC2PZY0_9HYME|nr:hypothetical protein QAD02_023984 [Eretmocerus hayati]